MSEELNVKIIDKNNSETFGEIITDGFFAKSVAKQMMKDDEAMTNEVVSGIFSNATEILNYCPNPNMTGEFKTTGIVIGKVQSGKTSNFIALLALAFDNGYNIAVVIGGNTKELLTQNVTRIENAFNVNKDKLVVLHSKDNHNLITSDRIRRWISNGTKVIIVSLKSPQVKTKKHMSKVSELFDDPVMSNENTIIIDDEGDQATLNSKAYSKDGELARTYQVAKEIKDKIKRHCFISITATPQANILIQTSDILSPDFGTLIYPGEGYCGLSTFHGEDEDMYVKEIPEEEDSLLDKEGDIPKTFIQALASFYVSNAIRKARGDDKVHSMLIHPSQKKIDHKLVQEKSNKFLENWRAIASLGVKDLAYTNDLKPILEEAYNNYKKDGVLLRNFEDYEREILNCISKSSDVLVFNSDSINARSDAGHFNTRIYLGGNILDRGITIKGLAITYIIRRAKGYSTLDNTEQRARWFGYKNVSGFSDYIDICRVWATDSIKKDFISINESDEDMWSSIERNISNGKSFKELPRYFVLQHDASHRLRLTRPNVAKTEDVSWTEWKRQKYYITGEKALQNFKLLEDLRLKTKGYMKDYGGFNKHFFVEDYPMEDFINSVLSSYNFNERDTLDKTLLQKIYDIVKNENMDSSIDLLWLRINDKETRKLNPDGTIQQLFRGRDIKKNAQGNYDYYGDSSTCDDRPHKIQIQIHYVKAKNISPNDYYSPAICIYMPEEYAFQLVGRKKDDK